MDCKNRAKSIPTKSKKRRALKQSDNELVKLSRALGTRNNNDARTRHIGADDDKKRRTALGKRNESKESHAPYNYEGRVASPIQDWRFQRCARASEACGKRQLSLIARANGTRGIGKPRAGDRFLCAKLASVYALVLMREKRR